MAVLWPISNGVKGLDDVKGLDRPRQGSRSVAWLSQECPLPPLEGRALHSQECFLPPRGGFNLRCTRERYMPKNVFFLREEDLIYDGPESLFLRWRGERYIPKNVSFLREEVLIYDAPESATFPRMFFSPRGGFNLRCTRER